MEEQEKLMLKQIYSIYSDLKNATTGNRPDYITYPMNLGKLLSMVEHLYRELNPEYLDEGNIQRLKKTIQTEGFRVDIISEKVAKNKTKSNYNKLEKAINDTNSHIERDIYSLLKKAEEITEAD